MIEVGVGDVGARVGTGDGVRVGTGVKVGVATGACVGATVGAAIGGAGAGESEGGGGTSVAGAARGGATVGSVGVVWLPSTTPSDGAGDEVTFGTAFVFGVALARAGELLGAVIGPCRGGAPPAEEKTINPPIRSPTTPPAMPSRN